MKLTPIQFMQKFWSDAVKSETDTGINRWVTLGQGACESGWDVSEAGHNNIFGIKSFNALEPRELVHTFEYNKRNDLTPVQIGLHEILSVSDQPNSNGNYRYEGTAYFKVFNSYEEAFDKHSSILLSSIYADARPFMNNPEAFVATIAPHYAPGNTGYAAVVISIIHSLQKINPQLYGPASSTTADHV